MEEWTRHPGLHHLKALCKKHGVVSGTDLLGHFSHLRPWWMDVKGWMCGAGEAPVPYLCDKEWHRWQPRTGWHSGDQMAFHNRTRWTQALILFFACEKAEDKQKKRLSIKIKRRVEQKKLKNYEFIQERRTENKQDKLDRLGFYLPVFCSSSQKKSNSCTFKQSCLMQNLFLRHFSMGIICILKRKKWPF